MRQSLFILVLSLGFFCSSSLVRASSDVPPASCSIALTQYKQARTEEDSLKAAQALAVLIGEQSGYLQLSWAQRKALKALARTYQHQVEKRDHRVRRIVKDSIWNYLWANGPFLWRPVGQLFTKSRVASLVATLEKKIKSDQDVFLFAHKLGVSPDLFFVRTLGEYFLSAEKPKEMLKRKHRLTLIAPALFSWAMMATGTSLSAQAADLIGAPNYQMEDYLHDIEKLDGVQVKGRNVLVVMDHAFLQNGSTGSFNPLRDRLHGMRPEEVRELVDLKEAAGTFHAESVRGFEQAADVVRRHPDADVRVFLFHGTIGSLIVGSEEWLHAVLPRLQTLPTKPGSVTIFLACDFGEMPMNLRPNRTETWVAFGKKLGSERVYAATNILRYHQTWWNPFESEQPPAPDTPVVANNGTVPVKGAPLRSETSIRQPEAPSILQISFAPVQGPTAETNPAEPKTSRGWRYLGAFVSSARIFLFNGALSPVNHISEIRNAPDRLDRGVYGAERGFRRYDVRTDEITYFSHAGEIKPEPPNLESIATSR